MTQSLESVALTELGKSVVSAQSVDHCLRCEYVFAEFDQGTEDTVDMYCSRRRRGRVQTYDVSQGLMQKVTIS
jgi:hypothetical protein